jgi:hypothetical protein
MDDIREAIEETVEEAVEEAVEEVLGDTANEASSEGVAEAIHDVSLNERLAQCQAEIAVLTERLFSLESQLTRQEFQAADAQQTAETALEVAAEAVEEVHSSREPEVEVEVIEPEPEPEKSEPETNRRSASLSWMGLR